MDLRLVSLLAQYYNKRPPPPSGEMAVCASIQRPFGSLVFVAHFGTGFGTGSCGFRLGCCGRVLLIRANELAQIDRVAGFIDDVDVAPGPREGLIAGHFADYRRDLALRV